MGQENLFSIQAGVMPGSAESASREFPELIATHINSVVSGEWKDISECLKFRDLREKVSELDRVLGGAVQGRNVIALLLPLSVKSLLLNTYLFQKGICVVNLSPDLTNEERICVMRSNGINLLITTNQAGFSGYAPDAAEVIYLHEIELALSSKSQVMQFTKFAGPGNIDVRYAFPEITTALKSLALVCKMDLETGVCCRQINSLELSQLISDMHKLYEHKGGETVMSDIPLYDFSGLVLELFYPLYYDLKVEIRP